MGNCQAAEAATVVIQHPGGKIERVYWSIGASQVMAANPGHYVALIITAPPSSSSSSSSTGGSGSSSSSRRGKTAAVRHLKLLRPDDTLRIGHVYRLVSFEEVLREFASKRRVKLSRLLVKHKERPASGRRSSSSSSSSSDGSGSSSSSRGSEGCSGDGHGDKQQSRSQLDEPESSPTTAADQVAEPSTEEEEEEEEEAETDQELELVARGMMGGGGNGGMRVALRHGHWRPTLQSIAEGSS